MQLNPRYDGPPLISLEFTVDDPSVPLLRQRRRLGEVLGGLDAAGWANPAEAPPSPERHPV